MGIFLGASSSVTLFASFFTQKDPFDSLFVTSVGLPTLHSRKQLQHFFNFVLSFFASVAVLAESCTLSFIPNSL